MLVKSETEKRKRNYYVQPHYLGEVHVRQIKRGTFVIQKLLESSIGDG